MGGPVVLGLGLGFLSIWAIGAGMQLARHHWWPLIPGGILTVVGGALLIGGTAVDMLDYWGVAVIAIGVFILGRAWVIRSIRPSTTGRHDRRLTVEDRLTSGELGERAANPRVRWHVRIPSPRCGGTR